MIGRFARFRAPRRAVEVGVAGGVVHCIPDEDRPACLACRRAPAHTPWSEETIMTTTCHIPGCAEVAREGYLSCRKHAAKGADLDGPPPPKAESSGSSWDSAAMFMWVLAALSLIGGAVFGLVLIFNSVQSCEADFLGNVTCSTVHRYRIDGAVVIVAGLVQAVAYGIVAKLCRFAGELRRVSR